MPTAVTMKPFNLCMAIFFISNGKISQNISKVYLQNIIYKIELSELVSPEM